MTASDEVRELDPGIIKTYHQVIFNSCYMTLHSF
jgi:hypothetical protein